jgi:hypothetical protein
MFVLLSLVCPCVNDDASLNVLRGFWKPVSIGNFSWQPPAPIAGGETTTRAGAVDHTARDIFYRQLQSC